MELFDAYNEAGEKTGQVLVRGEPIPDGVFKAVAETIVRHTDGTLLVTRRDPQKPVYPGHWELGSSGLVQSGETPLQAAHRELGEETGITGQTITPLYSVTEHQAHYHYFLCTTNWDKTVITLQPGETVDYRWLTWDEVLKLIELPHFVTTQAARLAPYFKEATP